MFQKHIDQANFTIRTKTARIGIKDYLRVEGLRKTFSSTSVKEKGVQGSLRVPDNVNFSCKAGEFITVVGSHFFS